MIAFYSRWLLRKDEPQSIKKLAKGMVLDLHLKSLHISNMLDVKFKWYMLNQSCLNIDFELLSKLSENTAKEFRNN